MKTRIIAAFSLLPLLLIVVLALPTIFTAILVGLMAAVAAYELLWGTGYVKQPRLVAYAAIMALLAALWSNLGMGYTWTLLGVLLFTAVMFAEIMLSGMKLPFEKVAVCFAAGLLIPYLLTALVRLHGMENGRCYILVPFLISFVSDSGAYFAGRFLGKHKLAPVISPKKTVEGAVGGVVAAVLGMMIYCLVLQLGFGFEVNYLYGIIYGVVGSAAAVFGDLCFSTIKRQTGIKDYGNLIPGHGGILDRFDSTVIVAPLVEALMMLIPVAVK